MDMLSSASSAIPGFNVGPGPKKGKKTVATKKKSMAKGAKAGSKSKASAKSAKAPAKTAPAKAPFKRTLGKAAGSFKRQGGMERGGSY